MALLQIDKSRLDIELGAIPQAIHDNAVRQANVKAELDAITNDLKLTMATTAAAIRLNPSDYGLKDKPSIPEVDGAVLASPGVQSLVKRQQEAQLAVDLCWAVTNGLNAKRDALPQLVRLYLNDYYSEPQPHETEAATLASEKRVEKENVAAQVADKPAKAKPTKKAKAAKAEALDPPEDRASDLTDTPSSGAALDGW